MELCIYIYMKMQSLIKVVMHVFDLAWHETCATPVLLSALWHTGLKPYALRFPSRKTLLLHVPAAFATSVVLGA